MQARYDRGTVTMEGPMGSNAIPTLFFLDPGFLAFIAVCAGVMGVVRLVKYLRGR